MPAAFQYRPRFVDIRVRPPEEEAADDSVALKPGERACDHPGCRRAAEAKAPKARDMPGEFYGFCRPHAAEYNRSWNWFAGLSEAEIAARQAEEIATGGRPTWTFKASNRSREAAAAANGGADGPAWFDPMGMFGGGRRKVSEPAAPEARRLGKLERQAFADLELEEDADPKAIRRAYAALVKRHHPDSNGGDRGAEARLQRVIRAYKTLQGAKRV